MSMSPIAWITFTILPLMALTIIFQFSLVTDLISKSGFSSAEVFSGIGGIYVIVMVIVGIAEVRT